MTARSALLLAALSALAACAAKEEPARDAADSAARVAAPDDPRGDTLVDTVYADSLRVSLAEMTRLPGGIYYRDTKRGTGPAADSGRTVTVHYTGWLSNGRVFDSSRERGEPVTFPLGEGRVIAGWDAGLAGMRAGGRRLLVIPPASGYGRAGKPGTIPSRATLVFDVALLKVR
ncbi:MAG TPA: FKBP-type peptidyl-prolyl cis-trans isomerase [Gemmatimonadaceae bacterium]|nr:FKBP-type peptidyl-prolyl cis-trans isomerase [Gemmatimonadaceae bacterium]